MAAAALVAISDGDASLQESERVGELLRSMGELRPFEPDEGIELYLAHVAAIRRGEAGRAAALAAVREIAQEEDLAAVIVVVCRAISAADGIILPEEVEETNRICDLLGVAPAGVRRAATRMMETATV